MKKVIILGAGSGQIPFITLCKNTGAEVIVISPPGNYPGFICADKKYYCDTRDKEKILEIAQNEKIDAILTDQTDVSVPTAAYVAEKMDLKGIGYETALKFTDKYIMRCEAQKLGVGVPNFGKASNIEEALKLVKAMTFPVMIKPTNSSGSRGVLRAETKEDVEKFVPVSLSFSSNHQVIIEEFIEGREYLADGIALGGKYRNLDIGIKEYFDKKGMYISKMCMFSSADLAENEIEKQVLAANQKIIEGFQLKFGITHAEYIYSYRDKKVYLVEVAARGGGVYLSSDLTPLASGVNTNKIIIDYVLNNTTVDISQITLRKKVSAWRCFELVPGKIIKIVQKKKIEEINGVTKACLSDLYIGKEIGELVNDTGKLGPILICADNRKQCYQIMKEVEKNLIIETENNGIVSGIKW